MRSALLAAGADPNAAGNRRRSRPLHYASDGYLNGPDYDPDRQIETLKLLLSAGADWDNGRIGAGPPPLRIPEGWLVIYHGNRRPERPGDVGAYSSGALLLAHEDPSRILRRSTTPLFAPQADFERAGFVPNVVFPTGIVGEGRSLNIYYGAGDTSSAVVRMSLDEILDGLSEEPAPHF